MAQFVDAGAEVHSYVLGEGIGARYGRGASSSRELGLLHSELLEAAGILGVTPHHGDLPDNRFDELALLDVVRLIEAMKAEVQPSLVLTHHAGDLNVDHGVTARAVVTAFRPLPGERPVTILGFETLSSTEWNVGSHSAPFVPNWFENAEPGLQRKLDAMRAYSHELREFPHPRSLRGIELATRRWGMTVGLGAAEPFVLLRHVGALEARPEVELRPVTPDDEALLLRWRNDPEIVRLGSSQEPVGPEEHHRWLAQQLSSEDALLMIGEFGGIPYGQVRFNRCGDGATISVYVAPGLEGRGLGRGLIEAGRARVLELWPVARIVACVRRGNSRALHAFLASGFSHSNVNHDCPPEHVTLVSERAEVRGR